MQEENIIRKEAKEFYDRKLNDSGKSAQPIDEFHKIKYRLDDFYTLESKALFLDEIQNCIIAELKKHRDRSHGGIPKESCVYEIRAEKLLFYIKQELLTFPTIAHQRFTSNPEQIRNKVFISYSHLDKEYLVDVQRHLKPFLNQMNVWDDTMILPGQKWKTEIKKAVEETKVAILLVSTDFLGSDFISSDELPPLLKAAEEDGAVILIVVIKPCLFEGFPELSQFQAMNAPNLPVSKMEYNEREELFVNLVRQTKRILDGVKAVSETIVLENENLIAAEK